MKLEMRREGQRPLSILLFGAGGHAKEVASAVRQLGHHPLIKGMGEHDPEWAKIPSMESLASVICDGWIVAIGDNPTRVRTFYLLQKLLSAPAMSIVHPAAWVDPSVELYDGTFVAAGAIVQQCHIGPCCIINSGAVVSHDCVLSGFNHLAPNAVLCGGAMVGTGAFIGANAVVKPGVRIGEIAVVGCGAAVVVEVAAGETVMGVPAKRKNAACSACGRATYPTLEFSYCDECRYEDGLGREWCEATSRYVPICELFTEEVTLGNNRDVTSEDTPETISPIRYEGGAAGELASPGSGTEQQGD